MPEVLLAARLAARRELRHGPPGCGLGGLAPGVGVDLGVQDQHVHVATASPARDRGRRIRCRRPSRRLPRSTRSSEPGRRPPPRDHLPGDRRVLRVGSRSSTDALHADLGSPRCFERGVPHINSHTRVATEVLLEPLDQLHGQRQPEHRALSASRGRTRRCPRTASSTTRAPSRRGRCSRASWAGCRRRSTSSPVALATRRRSPTCCVRSFRYGVSPQPAHAPENSNRGLDLLGALDRIRAHRPGAVGSAIAVKKSHELRSTSRCSAFGRHIDGLVLDLFLAPGRADVDADATSGAIVRSHLDRHQPPGVLAVLPLLVLESLGRIGRLTGS